MATLIFSRSVYFLQGFDLSPRYGACFGMVATHEESRYSRYGQVMDDIERSCRFYEHDGATVRLGRLQVYKRRGLSKSMATALSHPKSSRNGMEREWKIGEGHPSINEDCSCSTKISTGNLPELQKTPF